DLGGGLGDGLGAAQHGHIDVAADLQGGGDRLGGGFAQVGAVVIGDDQDRHQSTPASFLRRATRSAAPPTLIPALRPSGSATLTTVRRGAVSAPRSASGLISSGFFLAFMMLGREAKRGSLRRRSAVTTAGRSTAMVCRPPSISRVTVATLPATSSLEAKVAWGRSQSAASIWPTALLSPSMACLPRITRSGFSWSTRALSALATARGCRSSSVWIRRARSAPMAMAVRRVSWAWAGPIDTARISLATPFSFRRTASSTAISSKGFIDIFRLARSTPVWSALTRTLTLKSSTLFTGTSSFMG